MSEPFLSEIKIVSFNFPPKGWALANGQTLPINQNQALFSLLGTTYGGNGQTNFNLPNLRGRLAIHEGGGHTLGETAGTTSVTITSQTMPQHFHFMQASNGPADVAATATPPTNNYFTQAVAVPQGGGSTPVTRFANPPGNLVAMNPATVGNVGGSQAHTNMMPYLVLNFIIALQGIFPSQN